LCHIRDSDSLWEYVVGLWSKVDWDELDQKAISKWINKADVFSDATQ
jgi:hypothetical protein